jgi:hypothetical protein
MMQSSVTTDHTPGYRPQQPNAMNHHDKSRNALSPRSQQQEQYAMYDDSTMRGDQGGGSQLPKDSGLLHCRTNFGKEGGYTPPSFLGMSNKASGRNFEQYQQLELRQEQEVISARRLDRHDLATYDPPDDGADMPFDVLNDILRSNSDIGSPYGSNSNASPPQQRQGSHYDRGDLSPVSPISRIRQSKHTAWEGDTIHNELDPRIGRFTMSPPKFSDPTRFDYVWADEIKPSDINKAVARKTYGHLVDGQIEFLSPEKRGRGVSPSSSVTESVRQDDNDGPPPRDLLGPPRTHNDEDSVFDDLEDDKFSTPKLPLTGHSTINRMRSISPRPQQQPNKNRRRVRVPSPLYRQAADVDDGSLEEAPPMKINSPSTLQERAAAAWAVRREKNAILTAKKQKEEQVAQLQQLQKQQKEQQQHRHQQHQQLQQPKQQQQQQQHNSVKSEATKTGVSFGKADTVHHYMPDTEEDTTYYSDEDRSLNSEYTKTLESEVEDVVKDFLLIGHEQHSRPGRRKFKHKHSVKKKNWRKHKQLEREDNDAPRKDTVYENGDTETISQYRATAAKGTENESRKVPTKGDPKDFSNKRKIDGDKGVVGGSTEMYQRSLFDLAQDDSRLDVVSSHSGSMGNSPSNSPSKGNSSTKNQNSNSSKDPLQLMLGFMEGGVTAMTSALDYFSFEPPKKNEREKQVKRKKEMKSPPNRNNIFLPPNSTRGFPSTEDHANAVDGSFNDEKPDGTPSLSEEGSGSYVISTTSTMESRTCTDQVLPFLKIQNDGLDDPTSTLPKVSTGMLELMGYAQDLLLGPVESESSKGGSGVSLPVSSFLHSCVDSVSSRINFVFQSVEEIQRGMSRSLDSQDVDDRYIDDEEDVDDLPFSDNLEDDPQLLILARSAAQAHHELKGIFYDPSSGIDLYTEIKFSVVELKLPLGRKYHMVMISKVGRVGYRL